MKTGAKVKVHIKICCPTCGGTGRIYSPSKFCNNCEYKSTKVYCRMGMKIGLNRRKCIHKKETKS